MDKKHKISFDFDSTLDKETIQEYASKLKLMGFDIWIVTSRLVTSRCWSPQSNDDLYEVAMKLGIPYKKIHFTNGGNKSEFFKDSDFVLHLDDDWVEIDLINDETNTVAISVWGNTEWEGKSNEVIEKLK